MNTLQLVEFLSTKNMIRDVNKLNADALKLSGEDRNGYSEDNFGRYSQTTHLGAGIVADATSGRIGDMNLVGSIFAGGDTRNLKIGKLQMQNDVTSQTELAEMFPQTEAIRIQLKLSMQMETSRM